MVILIEIINVIIIPFNYILARTLVIIPFCRYIIIAFVFIYFKYLAWLIKIYIIYYNSLI